MFDDGFSVLFFFFLFSFFFLYSMSCESGYALNLFYFINFTISFPSDHCHALCCFRWFFFSSFFSLIFWLKSTKLVKFEKFVHYWNTYHWKVHKPKMQFHPSRCFEWLKWNEFTSLITTSMRTNPIIQTLCTECDNNANKRRKKKLLETLWSPWK